MHYSAFDLGLEDLNPNISAEIDDHGICLEWQEYLAFHAENSPELFDEDGWMTPDVERKIRAHAQEHYDADVEFFGGDDPHFTLVWSIPSMSPEKIGEYMWDTLARVANETDPGSFGSRYLFGSIL